MTLNTKASSDLEIEDFIQKMSIKHTRVAVVGNVDAGKSTLIGSLTTGILDNGRGQSRQFIMKHPHEIDTGRTSDIGTHLLGYDKDGVPMNSRSSGKQKIKTEDQVAAEASNLVSLMDLAGHEKYLKSTIHGVSSGMIDYAMVLVNARQPPNQMTLQHISLIAAFGIPFIIVLTKTDGCPKHALKNTKDEINAILRSPEIQKKAYAIKKDTDVDMVKDKLHAIAPVVGISSVTGEGYDLLNHVLCSLPKRRRHHNKIGRSLEYLVEDTFFVTGAGVVVSGFMNAGTLSVGETVWVGPSGTDGEFIKTSVKSIHLSRVSVNKTIAGNSACLALSMDKKQRKLLRRGMVILKNPDNASQVFEADMFVMKGSGIIDGTTIRKKYQTMVHILHVKQAAQIENIEMKEDVMVPGSMLDENDDVVVRPGNRAKITFRFLKRKEFIRTGMRVLFRDGSARAFGVITAVKDG
jgi:elongation factor 1-alpha